jgi:biopolymer transport protein ExbB
MNHNLFLWPVGAAGLIALGIALERFYYLFVRAGLAPGPFMAEIQKLVLAGRIDRALAHCASAPNAPLAKVVRAALQSADAPREDLELAVDQAALDAAPTVQSRLGYLATIANVVTLIGLLGTISGLITSFAAVADADPEQKQSMLAAGIATAMYATAGGLTVAIPTLVAYAILVARSNAILDDCDRFGAKMVMLLGARKRGEPPAAESA